MKAVKINNIVYEKASRTTYQYLGETCDNYVLLRLIHPTQTVHIKEPMANFLHRLKLQHIQVYIENKIEDQKIYKNEYKLSKTEYYEAITNQRDNELQNVTSIKNGRTAANK